MNDNTNYLVAIALSILVLVAWHFFYNVPQLERQRALEAQQQSIELGTGETTDVGAPAPSDVGAPQPTADGAPPQPAATPAPPEADREASLAEAPRIKIDTPRLEGSVSLIGGRIDDLELRTYHETVDPTSPNIVLLSPPGTANPYYAEFGWVAADQSLTMPGATTEWTPVSNGPLTIDNPLVMRFDAGNGLVFERTISVDEDYLFTITDRVENTSDKGVTLYPYGLISRHGTPETTKFFILHEGLIGVLGEKGLVEIHYGDLSEGMQRYNATNGWVGITDKYWATALIPPQGQAYEARFAQGASGDTPTYQTDYRLGAVEVGPGGTTEETSRLFAGAKEVAIVDGYEAKYGIEKFELLIDWGWLYFLTKPMFYALDFFYRMVGNFGIAILIVTVMVKLAFFPLANAAYKSMSKMKKVQPEMLKLRERHADDRMKQQQAMMELYKREKINPLSGCLPILIQIPVFFSLYKVLFVTIEMRHAPFFGWIQDLSAPDPTSVFNLFGLIPWAPPVFLMIGVWPLLMGITMWVQMKLNPPPPDPTQAMIFNWMPVLFVFLLATFPAGLVIYWTWNNSLSILQQSYIMRRQGVPIDIWDNIKLGFGRGSAAKTAASTNATDTKADDSEPAEAAANAEVAETDAVDTAETVAEAAEEESAPKKKQHQPRSQRPSRRKRGKSSRPANQPGE